MKSSEAVYSLPGRSGRPDGRGANQTCGLISSLFWALADWVDEVDVVVAELLVVIELVEDGVDTDCEEDDEPIVD